jgi:hypothetical protein
VSTAVTDSAPRGIKRKAPAPAKKPQKRKKFVSSDEDSDAALSDPPAQVDEPSDAEREPVKKPTRRQKKVVAEDSDEEEIAPPKSLPQEENKDPESEEDAETIPSGKDTGRPATPPPAANDGGAESDLSSVLDESPVKKRKRNTKNPAKAAKFPDQIEGSQNRRRPRPGRDKAVAGLAREVWHTKSLGKGARQMRHFQR